jgi:hypothetical protein
MDGRAWHKLDAVVTFETYFACISAKGTVFGLDKDTALHMMHIGA